MKRITLIVNPVAGKMKVKQTMFEIVQRFCYAGYSVSVQITKERGDAMKTAESLTRDTCDTVVCAGGDGTLNEVICGIIRSGSGLDIGYIPCGSTNDFAHSMKLPTSANLACEQIIEGKPTPIDVGLFDGKRSFSYISSFGAFTEASYNTPQNLKNAFGHFAYVIEGFKSLGNIKPYKLSVTANGKTFSGEYVFGAVANSTSIAGVLKLPESSVDISDGLFEVILAKNPQDASELNELVGAVVTANLKSRMLTSFKASKIEIRSEKPLTWTLDGEREDGGCTAVIENLHNKINLIM